MTSWHPILPKLRVISSISERKEGGGAAPRTRSRCVPGGRRGEARCDQTGLTPAPWAAARRFGGLLVLLDS